MGEREKVSRKDKERGGERKIAKIEAGVATAAIRKRTKTAAKREIRRTRIVAAKTRISLRKTKREVDRTGIKIKTRTKTKTKTSGVASRRKLRKKREKRAMKRNWMKVGRRTTIGCWSKKEKKKSRRSTTSTMPMSKTLAKMTKWRRRRGAIEKRKPAKKLVYVKEK